ncbi:MAG: hypothetical protein JWR50_1700 [Mucilaginibacter sp.]|nr:hypothetical protein [Mucilaginibacter sp.]
MKQLKLLFAAALIALTAVSCKKTTPYTPPPAISAISFYDAIPDAPALSIYLNTSKLSNDSLKYKSAFGYSTAYSGSREIIAYKGNDKKISQTVTLKEGLFYSAFFTGNYAAPEVVLLEDSLTNPPTTKANIRFVNMSIGAPALDLGVNDGTTVIANRLYKANSPYTAINGNKQYTFVVRTHGETVAKVTMPSVNILTGHNYTIWARGVYTATDATALGADIVLNY